VARAEFIRTQVQIVGLPTNHRVRVRGLARAADLWAVHRHAWREPMPDIPGVNWRGYDRGFFATIDVDQMDRFVRHAAEIFAAAPVQSVRILAAHPNVTRALAALPELLRLRELDLTACRGARTPENAVGDGIDDYRWNTTGVLTDADATTLAGSPGLANLRVLRLGGNRIDVGALALASSPHLRNLRRLDIGERELSHAVRAALVRAFPDAEVR
jgi:hypothetical protein